MRNTLLLVLVLSADQWSARAFQSSCQSPSPTETIDGSACPDLIPDAVAFRLFLSAMARNPATQNAKLYPIGLGDADAQILLHVLPSFATAMSNAIAIQGPLDAVAQSTISSLAVKMSQPGFQSLQAYVRSQKKFMKRAPFPPMQTHN